MQKSACKILQKFLHSPLLGIQEGFGEGVVLDFESCDLTFTKTRRVSESGTYMNRSNPLSSPVNFCEIRIMPLSWSPSPCFFAQFCPKLPVRCLTKNVVLWPVVKMENAVWREQRKGKALEICKARSAKPSIPSFIYSPVFKKKKKNILNTPFTSVTLLVTGNKSEGGRCESTSPREHRPASLPQLKRSLPRGLRLQKHSLSLPPAVTAPHGLQNHQTSYTRMM